MNEIQENLKFIAQNYKNLIEIIDDITKSFMDNRLNLLEIQNFFRKLGIFSANEFFGEQKIMLNAKISSDFIVKSQNRSQSFNENLSRLCNIISEDPSRFYELVMFLSKWIELEFLPNYEILITQINLINSGVLPEVAYEKSIKIDKKENLLTKSINSLINAILIKNCELTKLNQHLSEKLKIAENNLQKSKQNISQIDEVSGLPNRNLAVENINLFLQNRQISLTILKILNLDKFVDNYSLDFAYDAIKQVSQIIKNQINSGDFLFKTMFNEFMIISTNLQTNLLINTASKIQKSIKHLKFNKETLNIALAITISNANTKSAQDLIEICNKKFQDKKLKNQSIKI